MRDPDLPPATLDALLEGAAALEITPEPDGPPSARERIRRARIRRRSEASAGWYTASDYSGSDYAGSGNTVPDAYPTAIATHPGTAPPHAHSEHEQARHELDLACALVLNTPQAAACLSRLVNDRQLDPEGALVFACLLYLTNRDNPAQFWWQLAAGGGSYTAAYCLYLHHRRFGEYRDAEYWRRQGAVLRGATEPPATITVTVDRPLVPEEVRRDILAQCHAGQRPHLPSGLEAVIDQLAVDGEDDALGGIPRPSEGLSGELLAPQ